MRPPGQIAVMRKTGRRWAQRTSRARHISAAPHTAPPRVPAPLQTTGWPSEGAAPARRWRSCWRGRRPSWTGSAPRRVTRTAARRRPGPRPPRGGGRTGPPPLHRAAATPAAPPPAQPPPHWALQPAGMLRFPLPPTPSPCPLPPSLYPSRLPLPLLSAHCHASTCLWRTLPHARLC